MGTRRKPHVDGAIVDLVVQPKSSRSELIGFDGGVLRVRVCAAPVQGAANTECIALLARAFRVAKSRVHLVKGASGRRKRVIVEGVDSTAAKGLLLKALADAE